MASPERDIGALLTKAAEEEDISPEYNDLTTLKPLIAERAAALNAKKYVLMGELDDLIKIILERHKRSQAEVDDFFAKKGCSRAAALEQRQHMQNWMLFQKPWMRCV